MLSSLLFAILLPFIILTAVVSWLFETRSDRARRLYASGRSQQSIADHLGCSRSTVRKLLAP